jgi:hypothetical protein
MISTAEMNVEMQIKQVMTIPYAFFSFSLIVEELNIRLERMTTNAMMFQLMHKQSNIKSCQHQNGLQN